VVEVFFSINKIKPQTHSCVVCGLHVVMSVIGNVCVCMCAHVCVCVWCVLCLSVCLIGRFSVNFLLNGSFELRPLRKSMMNRY